MAKSSKPTRRQAIERVIPLLSAAALVAVSALIYRVAVHPLLPHGLGLRLSPIPHPSRPYVELRAVPWWITMTLYLGAALVAFYVALRALYQLWWRPGHVRRGWLFAAGIGALALLVFGTLYPVSHLMVLDTLITDLLLHTRVFNVFGFANTLSVLAGVCFAVAACACLNPEPRSPDGADARARREARADWLKRQASSLQSIMYSAAAALVAGVAEIDAVFGWAAAHIEGPGADATAKLITQIAAGATGTWFSMLLASVYLPAAVVLHARIRALGDEAAAEGADRAGWLSARGLDVRLKTQVSSVLAILAPALTAGPLGALGHAFG